MFLVFLIGSVALQAWAWRRLITHLQRGSLTKLRSAAQYAAWAFLPLLCFVAVFFAMVGLEEWLRVPLIEERTALLALPVLGLSTLGTLGFLVRCAFVERGSPAG